MNLQHASDWKSAMLTLMQDQFLVARLSKKIDPAAPTNKSKNK